MIPGFEDIGSPAFPTLRQVMEAPPSVTKSSSGIFKGATLRGSREFVAHTILEICGSHLNPLRKYSLNI